MCETNRYARYTEDPDGQIPHPKSWMDYVEDKNTSNIPPSNVVMRMLEDVSEGQNPNKVKDLGKGFSTYNPYDYNTPNTAPKDLKGGPPFDGGLPYFPDQGYFNDAKVFDEDTGVLKDWYKSRRIDWTDDPTEQSPAMSADRKYAGTSNVLGLYALNKFPMVMPEVSLGDINSRCKEGASLKQIIDSDTHYKNDLKINRSNACSASWVNKKDSASGLFVFRVTCPPDNNSRLVYFQFLRGDKESQVDSYLNYPVQLSCSCPSFLWYGAQYYAIAEDYIYYPGFRINPGTVMSPKAPDTYTVHVSPRYPGGKKHPGRGYNFRVCKHILAAYNLVKGMRVVKQFKKYPVTSPPSSIMNADVWKRLMKFDFNEDNIKERLKSIKPSIPAYFRRENITQSVIDWFNDVWMPRTDDEKIKTLKTMLESPEKIFFILMKEAYLKRSKGEKISDRLIDEGYKLMEKIVQPENEQEPQKADMPGVPEDQRGTGEDGTGISEPGGETPADDFIKGVHPTVKRVMQKTKRVQPGIDKKEDNEDTDIKDKNTDGAGRFE